MKKIFSIIFILLAYTAYAENDIEEHGFGASESDDIINTRQAPSNPVFNEDDYLVLKSADYVAVKMDNEQFCKNITIIRKDTQSPNMAFNDDDYFKAGPLFITTDRVLEDRGFYRYSNELLAHYGMSVDDRPKTYLEEAGSTEANMRSAKYDNYYYYDTAFSIYESTTLTNILKDYISNTEVDIIRRQYAIPAQNSSTGYKEINYELITYYTNHPDVSENHDVSNYNQTGSLTSIGDYADANILGCYAVQHVWETDLQHNIDYDNEFEFYWLVSYRFKGNDYNVQLKNRTNMPQKQDVMHSQDDIIDIDYDWRNIIKTN